MLTRVPGPISYVQFDSAAGMKAGVLQQVFRVVRGRGRYIGRRFYLLAARSGA